MKCFNCDKKIKSSGTYCSNCGTNLKKVEIINDVQKEISIDDAYFRDDSEYKYNDVSLLNL